MTYRSNIKWTELTWNPSTGCSKVSSGCKYCYAERWAIMHQKRGIRQYTEGFKFAIAPDRLEAPLKIKEPRIIFVNSMSDLFHEGMPDEYLIRVFEVMNRAPQHQFQILTKRSEKLKALISKVHISDNIWIGVSVENVETTFRIKDLQDVGFKNSFISFEPLIGPIPNIDLAGICWVIVGGESGPRARKVEKDWIISIKELCEKQNIPFFFKQWGKTQFNPDQQDKTIIKTHPNHAIGGCQLNGLTYLHNPIANKLLCPENFNHIAI